MRISTLLPGFLARRLAGRDTLQRSVDNSFWLLLDQAVRMAAGLFVGVWIARYLGPEQYGWLSYSAALASTVGVVTSLGLNAVVVRELARDPAATPGWMGAVLFLRSAGGAVGFAACLAAAALQAPALAPTRPLIMLAGAGLVLQVADIYDVLFQARGEARYSAMVRIFGCVAANLLKIALILGGGSLLSLAAATLAELAFCAAGWLRVGLVRGLRPGAFALDRSRILALLREGWPLALSGLAIYTQAYADQLIVGAMLGGADLGQYAAAMRLVTAFAFVPIVVQTVAAPEIARAHRDDHELYRRRLYDFYRLMYGLFAVTALPLMLLGPLATRLVFGPSYEGAATLLPLLSLRLFFTNFGMARSVFITNEGLFLFGLVTAIAGAMVNVGLNLLLVPRWGVHGAIASSLASFAVTTFLLEVFQTAARSNLRLMARAVVLPWRPYSR